MNLFRTLRAAALGSLLGLTGQAAALEVTSGFSGWWDQPEQEAHGLIIVVAKLADGSTSGVAYWAIYDDGAPSWLIAQGPIVGDTIAADLFQVTGVDFLEPTEPATNPANAIGTMDITFEDCNEGEVTFQTSDPAIGSGSFPIERLTTMPGQVCSGGIGDDFPPDVPPEDLHIDLDPTGAIAGADGEAELQIRPGRVSFRVEIEQVPDGIYTLNVADEPRGEIFVVDGEGEIRFRSPQVPNTELLDFDPRGEFIDVVIDGVVVLTAEAPEEGTVPGFQHGGGPPAFGGDDIEIDLDNLGVYPDGSAEAEYEQDGEALRFEVEVDDIPAGSYALRVGGEERGLIEVVADDDGETEGSIEFRSPPEGGTPVLDFDPLGALIEILEGDTVLFSAEFPLEGDDDDGGPPGGDFPVQDATLTLDNAGVFPDAEAEATYERRGARETFTIEVDGLPAGSYPLLVDGAEVASIGVDEDGEGSLAFRRPGDNPAFLTLDFEPIDSPIEIRAEDGTVLFSGALTL